jgi:peptide/nickel transport system permease protein
VLGLTLVGESMNDLADPRLRTRRAADVGPEAAPTDLEPTDLESTGGASS